MVKTIEDKLFSVLTSKLGTDKGINKYGELVSTIFFKHYNNMNYKDYTRLKEESYNIYIWKYSMN